ncbi:TM2 domain-containing protein [Brevibacillus borstelensis]|uniref:TM2 domain-containing protein n=1 Tax=Brevibacillus borstelensis TaxID=45462 RepID=UPI00287F60E4|nr:TM2 domain-containing protein [Brevibacillus borstelensis]WNF07481.1 TM2 domain-containing protein [Brevibacillus borstelensis]
MDNLLAKQDFTTQELQMLSSEMDKKKKSTGAAWLLWFFFGGIGGHRYYLGKYGTAILMTFTLGFVGIWTVIDAFLLNGMIQKTNEAIEGDLIQKILTVRKAKENTAAQANV